MRRFCMIALAMTLTGCAVGPDYEPPEIETPADFREQIDEGASFANTDWWEVYEDTELDRLIRIALEQNNQVAIATARLEEARARYGFVRADLYPRVDINLSGNRGNQGEVIVPGLGVQETYLLSGDLSWEVDLFGKLRRSSEAARAEFMASAENRRAVYIALIADVANAYLALRDLDARRDISARTLATRRESTRIIRARFEQGTTPMLDVNQAEINEAQAAADLALYERQVVQAENLLSILIGRNPGNISRGKTLADLPLPPSVPAGLPSELLQRRPDVREAEQLLAAQTARIGVAQALRWPTLSLTASSGLASNDLADIGDGDSIWNVGGNIFQPLFNAGQNKRRVEVEVARTEQLLQAYEFTVLNAFREVEDALVSLRTLADESAARDMQVAAARNAARLSRARYDGGVTSYLEVLDTERSLFQAEIAASGTRRAWLSAVVDLYKALGGGWVPEEEE